jgi:hypothetical protein
VLTLKIKMKIKSEPIKTVLTIATALAIVYYFFHYQWALVASIVLGLIGMFSTYLTQKIDWAWMKLTFLLSLVVPNILLSAVFFLFLFPIATLAKIFGKKDPLLLQNGVKSTFVEVGRSFDKGSFEKMW